MSRGARRWGASALRAGIPLVLVAITAAGCCPATAPAASAPTAFTATVEAVGAPGGGWQARLGDGRRLDLPGPAPAAPGERVYLRGRWLPDGRLSLSDAQRLPPAAG